MVMALKKAKSGEDLKKCWSACSARKRCLKYGPKEDDIELLVAPRWRWGNDQEDLNLEADNPSAPRMEAEAEGFSLISGRTQGKKKRVAEPAPLQAPL